MHGSFWQCKYCSLNCTYHCGPCSQQYSYRLTYFKLIHCQHSMHNFPVTSPLQNKSQHVVFKYNCAFISVAWCSLNEWETTATTKKNTLNKSWCYISGYIIFSPSGQVVGSGLQTLVWYGSEDAISTALHSVFRNPEITMATSECCLLTFAFHAHTLSPMKLTGKFTSVAKLCTENSLLLNISKTKELIDEFR